MQQRGSWSFHPMAQVTVSVASVIPAAGIDARARARAVCSDITIIWAPVRITRKPEVVAPISRHLPGVQRGQTSMAPERQLRCTFASTHRNMRSILACQALHNERRANPKTQPCRYKKHTNKVERLESSSRPTKLGDLLYVSR